MPEEQFERLSTPEKIAYLDRMLRVLQAAQIGLHDPGRSDPNEIKAGKSD